MLQQGEQWLENQRKKYLSAPVVYVFKDGTELNLEATIGRTVFRAENEYGATVRTESRDFFIAATDLESDPERGDAVFYDDHRFEVLAPNNEPVWRWTGSGRLTRRIHTKDVGEVGHAERE
jgi:hypothetical protein